MRFTVSRCHDKLHFFLISLSAARDKRETADALTSSYSESQLSSLVDAKCNYKMINASHHPLIDRLTVTACAIVFYSLPKGPLCLKPSFLLY